MPQAAGVALQGWWALPLVAGATVGRRLPHGAAPQPHQRAWMKDILPLQEQGRSSSPPAGGSAHVRGLEVWQQAWAALCVLHPSCPPRK